MPLPSKLSKVEVDGLMVRLGLNKHYSVSPYTIYIGQTGNDRVLVHTDSWETGTDDLMASLEPLEINREMVERAYTPPL